MANFRRTFIVLSVLSLVIVPLWPGIAGLGVRFDFWSIGFGLGTMSRDWWTIVRYAGMAIGLVTLVSHVVGERRLLLGMFIGVLAMAVPIWAKIQSDRVWATARSAPAIHDITTDREDPPRFTSAIMVLRDAEDANSVDYIGKVKPGRNGEPDRLVSDIQAEAYPDIVPIELEMSPERAFELALNVAERSGWKVESASRDQLLIEATDTTFWYGFKDDVVIRIRSNANGSIVDVRSISRIGGSDLGKNADRIRDFRRKLAKRSES